MHADKTMRAEARALIRDIGVENAIVRARAEMHRFDAVGDDASADGWRARLDYIAEIKEVIDLVDEIAERERTTQAEVA